MIEKILIGVLVLITLYHIYMEFKINTNDYEDREFRLEINRLNFLVNSFYYFVIPTLVYLLIKNIK